MESSTEQKKYWTSNPVSHKKGLSHFIPRLVSPWDPVNQFGNPTRSEDSNIVVSNVKKLKGRKQGIEPIEYKEYENILQLNKHEKVMKSQKLKDQRNNFKTSSLLTV